MTDCAPRLILDHQLAAVIVVGLVEEERRRQIAAQPEIAAALDAHRIVDMRAERLRRRRSG